MTIKDWKMHVVDQPHRCIHDAITKLTILQHARGKADYALDEDPEFRHLPYNITRPEVAGIVSAWAVLSARDDEAQDAYIKRRSRVDMGFIPSHPVRLATEVRTHMTPMRQDILQWYIERRVDCHKQVIALERVMHLRDPLLLRLTKEYARQVVEALRTPAPPLSTPKILRLIPDESMRVTAAQVTRAHLLGVAVVTERHLPGFSVEQATAVRQYAHDLRRRQIIIEEKIEKEWRRALADKKRTPVEHDGETA